MEGIGYIIYHVETTAGFDKGLESLTGIRSAFEESGSKKIWKAVLIQGSMGKD